LGLKSERTAHQLADIIDLIGGGTPKTSVPEYWNGDIPWLSVKDFNNDDRYVYVTEKSITVAGLNNSSTKMLAHDDIIISARGTVGELAMIPFPMAFNQSCYGIRGKMGVIVQTYLYYLLKDSIRLLKSQTHGSVFDTITRDTFANIEVSLPSLEEQRVIADTLSALDARIANNRAINNHLEHMAQAIFVDFLARIDGKVSKLKELCAFQEGYVNPSQSRADFFDGEVKWLRAVDINGSFIFDTSRTLTRAGFESAGKSAYLFRPDTIAISKSGTIGRLGLVADFMCGNRAVINIAPYDTRLLPFVYLYLKSRQAEYADLAVGSVQKNLYVPILQGLDVLVPEQGVLLDFCTSVAPLFEKWKGNVAENRTLSQIRDSLLPRLMSGELSVADLGEAK
jgi:type I restriction enzyme S subunit